MADKPLIVIIDDEPMLTRSIPVEVRRAGRYDCLTIFTTDELVTLIKAGRQRENTVFLYDHTFQELDPEKVVPMLKELGKVGLLSEWPNEEVLPLVRELDIPFFGA